MKETITIYDIARESGVSVSTVSRVLNHSPRVSEKTRAAVERVIAEHHYSPNAIARAMTNQSTHSIGVVLPDITNPYFSALFLEIQRYALARGYSVLLYNTLFGGSSHAIGSPFEELHYFDMLKEKCVDGAIVVGGQMDLDHPSEAYVQALNRLNRALPVVAIGQPLEGCECLFITRNLSGGISALLQHLVALGNHSIGFIGGQLGVRQTTERLRAYRDTMKALGLPVREEWIVLSNYYSEDGYTAMRGILKGTQRPDAVIAINDQVALGAIRAVRDAKLSVPEDLAIASCDSFPNGEYHIPRLTGLDQQNEYIGKLAILSLLSAMQGVRETVSIHHVPTLVIRESCGSRGIGL